MADDIFDKMRIDIRAYDVNKCDVKVTDLEKIGSVINEGETFRFKVEVKNIGSLDMLNVVVGAYDTTYADVYIPPVIIRPPRPAVLTPELEPIGGVVGIWPPRPVLSQPINVPAFSTRKTGYFNAKAKKDTGGNKNIVTVRIIQWDASLDHILKDNTSWGDSAVLNVSISPA